MTKIQITPRHTDVKPVDHYVYIHQRTTDGSPFYVGKGTTNRGFRSSLRSDWWMHIGRKHGVTVIIAQDGLTKDESLLLEMWLIAKLRHEGHVLCNMTEGGGGNFGITPANARPVFCSNGMSFEKVMDAIQWLKSIGKERASHSAISQCAAGNQKTAYGFKWSYDPKQDWEMIDVTPKRRSDSRNVYCSNGMIFDGVCRAELWATNGDSFSGSMIAAAAKREGYSKGHNWSYCGFPEVPDIKAKKRDAVERARVKKARSLRRSDGKIYECSKYAADDLVLECSIKTATSAIYRCAKGDRPSAYGYEWSFIDLTPNDRIVSRQDQPSLFAEHHGGLHSATGEP